MIKEKYNDVLNTESDIQYNLPILNYFAKQCRHITEMGVRAMVSSWALLDGLRNSKGKLVAIDLESPIKYGVDLERIIKECKEENVILDFIQGNTLKIEIEPTDMLFIDTIHTKQQLSKELKLNAGKVEKFIAFHDTVSCPEILETIYWFMFVNPSWKIVFNGNLSNGLIVIQKYAQ